MWLLLPEMAQMMLLHYMRFDLDDIKYICHEMLHCFMINSQFTLFMTFRLILVLQWAFREQR